MEIVDEVTAADDEDALLPEGRKAFADFVVERRCWSLSNAELNHGNVCVRVHVAQHRPRPVVEPPSVVQSHRDWGEERLDAQGKLWVAGCRILHLIKFSREPAEVVDCPWSGAHGHRSVLNVPVRRNANDSLWFGQLFSNRRPLLGVGISEHGVHWVPVPEKHGWHPL
jgi:hypothetical protein